MHPTGAMVATAIVAQRMFPPVLLLCLAVSGCGYTCVSGFWNGNGSGVAVSNTSCPLTKATGAVIVEVNGASAPPGGAAAIPSPRDILHIFVTLRGIEAHPDRMANEDSSEWQELAPDLTAHPIQLDLLAPKAPLAMTGDAGSLGLSANFNFPTTIPADEYRQLRLRLVPLHPSPDDLIPQSNACGDVGWNCIVFADRSVRPLEFDNAAAEFPIPPQHEAGSVFRVLPGEVIHLSIEFDAAFSLFFASNVAVRLVPVFRVVSRSSSPAASAE